MAAEHELQLAGCDRRHGRARRGRGDRRRASHRGEVLALPRRQRDHGHQPRRRPGARSPSTPRRARCCATPTSAGGSATARSTSPPACCVARGTSTARPPRVPSVDEVDAARALIGWSRVELERARRAPAGTPGWRSTSAASARSTRRIAPTSVLAAHGVAARAGQPRRRRARARRPGRRPAVAHRHHPPARGRCRDRRGRSRRRRDRHQRRLPALLRGRRPPLRAHPRSAHRLAGRATGSRRASSRRCARVAGSLATVAMLRADAPAFLAAQRVQYLLVDEKGRRIGSAGLD